MLFKIAFDECSVTQILEPSVELSRCENFFHCPELTMSINFHFRRFPLFKIAGAFNWLFTKQQKAY